MIEDSSPLIQTLLATFFTWGFTALGAALVFVVRGYQRWFLDASLGFAAGVMTAASFWSLLLPALEIAEQLYDGNKFLSLIPIVIGFFIGAGFVYLTDAFMPENFIEEEIRKNESKNENKISYDESIDNYTKKSDNVNSVEINLNSIRQRTLVANVQTKNESKWNPENTSSLSSDLMYKDKKHAQTVSQFRKIILLIIAVTVHNIPEGLAVGVGFGAVGKTKSASFQNARNLAFGIGIQNFPEGLAVSLPLYASGYSYWRSFWYGQLSGMVEPIAGILGTLAVGAAQQILPYALAFAAGAMLYVVFENIIPEASANGNGKLATWSCLIGFCVMMTLDAGLG